MHGHVEFEFGLADLRLLAQMRAGDTQVRGESQAGADGTYVVAIGLDESVQDPTEEGHGPHEAITDPDGR